jgi:hypothetical protein
MRELRKLAQLVESNTGSIQKNVADAIPSLIAVPELQNQDAYRQYRMGLALAAARAVENGDIEFKNDSDWGENMLLVAQTEEGRRTIELALKLVGVRSKTMTTATSDEMSDTQTSSPVAKFVPTKRPR